jgi:hypothetical protein
VQALMILALGNVFNDTGLSQRFSGYLANYRYWKTKKEVD